MAVDVNAAPNYTGVPVNTDYTGPKYDPEQNVYTQSLIKEALLYRRDASVFSSLGSTADQPAHMGLTLTQFVELPLLDDRNKNDQGIDAKGYKIANGNLYGSSNNIGQIQAALPTLSEGGGRVNRVGLTRIKQSSTIQPYGIFSELDNYMLNFDNQADLGRSIIRRVLDGTLELYDHLTQIAVMQNIGTQIFTGAANSISTIDPTNPGTSPADKNGSLLNLHHLLRLDEMLNNNRTPYSAVLLDGSRNVDTRTVRTSRIAFCGIELVNYLRTLQNPFGQPAFIDVSQYSSQGNVLENEVGTIGGYRIIQPRRMFNWTAQGAAVGKDGGAGFRTSTDSSGTQRYNVYPFLVIGEEAYATSSFEMSDGSFRMNLITKFPGRETAHAESDPYGERGFFSVKFWHGFLPLKNERIAAIFTALPIV